MSETGYADYYKGHLDKSFDEELGELCKKRVLRWMPWVGKNYAKHRILIVGESHYGKTRGDVKAEKDVADAMDDQEFTRKEIVGCASSANPPETNFYANTERVLIGASRPSKERRVSHWESVAFYNFVQRAVDYDKKERPSEADFQAGWRTFGSVVRALEPKVCVFLGVAASNYFNGAEFSGGFTRKGEITWGDALNSVYKREGGSVSLEDNKVIPIYFIKHPSSYFRWGEWNGYLGGKDGLRVFRSGGGSALPEPAASPEDSAGAPDGLLADGRLDVPKNLSHKPIVACDYTKTSPGEDAKFLSVGHAQYNGKEASVKILRHTGERWSRQSEEVPIQRLGHMMQLLLWAIRKSQEDGSAPTNLGETVLFPDEMDFLRREFHANRDGLVKSIREIRALIDTIDLDEI